MICKFLFIITTFLSLSALAEYRVFQLKIYKEAKSNSQDTSRVPQAQPGVPSQGQPADLPQEEGVKIFLSNMDPQQYVGYYPLEKDEKIKYIATWMCRGRTNGKDYCQDPRLKTVNTQGDSLNNK